MIIKRDRFFFCKKDIFEIDQILFFFFSFFHVFVEFHRSKRYRPVIFADGQRQRFPAPTKFIKPPQQAGKKCWGAGKMFQVVKCAIGSKLPLFPYNRGWETQPIRGFYIPIIRIPIKGGITIPNETRLLTMAQMSWTFGYQMNW